jgi:signal transduction histidine kinase
MEAGPPAGWRRRRPPGVHPAAGADPGFRRYRGPVLRSISARWETTRHGPVVDWSKPPPAIAAVRIIVLVMLVVTVPFASPHPGLTGAHAIAITIALAVSVVAWVVWLRSDSSYPAMVTALAVMAAAGGALAGLSPFSPAVAVGCVVTSSAGVRLSSEASLAITAETVAAFLIAGVTTGAPAETLAGYPAAFIGLWAFGLTRRAYLLRAEQAEEALEQARRAHAAENQAAALAERARIAREIHDVLAHSLAAVSVNLQAAEGLLGSLPADSRGSEVVRAMECIERAVAFTRDGMTETRRAILALRDRSDASGAGLGESAAGSAAAPTSEAPPAGAAVTPLVTELRALTEKYRADGDAVIDFDVTGAARPVGPEAALTAYRTAQESLTNARKHAPGQPVTLGLTFTPGELEVQVVNALPADAAAGPLARAGAGYGLTGLRERAALAGGTLTTGPDGGRWRVCLRIPV